MPYKVHDILAKIIRTKLLYIYYISLCCTKLQCGLKYTFCETLCYSWSLARKYHLKYISKGNDTFYDLCKKYKICGRNVIDLWCVGSGDEWRLMDTAAARCPRWQRVETAIVLSCWCVGSVEDFGKDLVREMRPPAGSGVGDGGRGSCPFIVDDGGGQGRRTCHTKLGSFLRPCNAAHYDDDVFVASTITLRT